MRIVVDSAYRNKSLWPRSDKYEFRLQTPIKNIHSIRLVESNIAFSSATTSQGYDRLYIRSDTGRSRSVGVAHGTYTDGVALADAFQVALDSQASDLSVTVSYTDNRLKFTSTTAFVLDDTDINAVDSMGRSVTYGESDSIARVAGLNSGEELKATSNGTDFEAVAPHDIDVGKDRYLVLSLDVAGDLISNVPDIDRALSTVTEGQREYRTTAHVQITPSRTVDRLRVTIKRPSGASYDFGGLDHRLEFCICS